VRALGLRSRHELLNWLISRYGYRSYLEIGVDRCHCWTHIRCAVKHCVDPAVPKATFPITSDAFFALPAAKGGPLERYDLIFVDGLHREDQVFRDVEHSLARLSPGGSILCHDCNPETEWEQRDAETYDGQGVWLGTTWRAWARLRMTRPDLAMAVMDADFGCGLIRRGRQALYVPPPGGISYPLLVRDRARLLNLIEPDRFPDWVAAQEA
jgi:hypothetical protein